MLLLDRIMVVDAIPQEKCVKDNVSMKGGEDEEIFHKSALKVVQAKNDSKGI